jgi:hypothetical protein
MSFALQTLGEPHVAQTEYARATRICDLDCPEIVMTHWHYLDV